MFVLTVKNHRKGGQKRPGPRRDGRWESADRRAGLKDHRRAIADVFLMDRFKIDLLFQNVIPIGSMYGIYANIWGIWMVNVTIYIAYMDPMS